MNPVIKEMLKNYHCKTPDAFKNALKEIIQEVALLGLSRQNFFKHAAFYGGTALRIAHKMQRFSEDLDFTLLSPDKSFDLLPYLKGIEEELAAYGFVFKAEKKIKQNESKVNSAFLKGNTLIHMLMIEELSHPAAGTNKNEMLKIKLEIDIDPPPISGNTEIKFHAQPIPFEYRILTLSSLYAGKLHAVLCREWKGDRIKGRDFYDFIWFRQKKILPDLSYLEAKMRQSGHYHAKDPLDQKILNALLEKKFTKVDWNLAKNDIRPFIDDPFALNVWSPEFFKDLLK